MPSLIHLLNKESGGAPKDNGAYTVNTPAGSAVYIYLERDGGYHLQIANPSSGYAYQGNMRTFQPKTGDPMLQLYTDYNSGYYPTVSSHSVSIVYEENKADPRHNIYTFTYVYMPSVDYRVEYRYKDDNVLIKQDGVGDGGSGIALKSTSKSVVTERFIPVTDYISDAFYKKLILSVERDSEGNFVSSKDNVIIFYYTQNSESAYYAVHYMLENSDGSGHTESTTLTEGIAAINKQITISPMIFSGFTPVRGETVSDGAVSETYPIDGKYSFIVTASGAELYIYYTRNTQHFTVYYLPDGTDISDIAHLPTTAHLKLPETGSGKFGDVITRLPADIDNYSCTTVGEKSIVLHGSDDQNYIIFYYIPLSYTVQYRVWDNGGGTLDNTIETKTSASAFTGSLPTPKAGYRFVGWYTDAECTAEVGSEHTVTSDMRLVPTLSALRPQPQQNIFYAKFLPLYGGLIIARDNADDEGDGAQSFVYKITSVTDTEYLLYLTLSGNDSKEILNIPVGDYTVEQVGDWSWRYSDSAKTITVTEGNCATVLFYTPSTHKKWLNGNSDPIMNIKEKG